MEKYYSELKDKGHTPLQDKKIQMELDGPRSHDPVQSDSPSQKTPDNSDKISTMSFYAQQDLLMLQSPGSYGVQHVPHAGLSSIDELLERDRQREKDGFPRKIRIGRLLKPGKGDGDSVVIVPTTVEEKFLHDSSFNPSSEEEGGGTGEGEDGEVIGEQPVRPERGEGTGAGEGQDAAHEMESSAYDLGRILTEKFELPNLKDRGNKRSLTRYTYDITDKNKGFGQVLDKKSTLRQILETNIALNRIGDVDEIDTTDLLVSPQDRIYRILSQEKDYESQAVVFFVRDYSGSMEGNCTELVVSQHVLIYSWLLYQYAKRVETRFILHDTSAKEVPDFYSYYNSRVAGGTQVASGYKMVNEIVEKENLAQDYNIYVFHGTDGDDWDTIGEKAIPELKKILEYASRVGITIATHSYAANEKTEVQRYVEKSGLLKDRADLLRLDVMNEDSNEDRIIEGIKRLISHEVPSY